MEAMGGGFTLGRRFWCAVVNEWALGRFFLRPGVSGPPLTVRCQT